MKMFALWTNKFKIKKERKINKEKKAIKLKALKSELLCNDFHFSEETK